MTGSKSNGSDRGPKAGAKGGKTARPAAPETDDSLKRQGDKLEQARDAAAGKPKR